jgi:hypothetical protein
VNLPFRLTPHRHVDDRVETIVKRHGAFHSRVLLDPRKLTTREDYIQAVVDYVTAINQALARAQRIELSAGPPVGMDDDEESH